MNKTQEPIKLAGTFGKYAGIETMREAKQALHAKDAEIAEAHDKIEELTNHVKSVIRRTDQEMERKRRDQSILADLISKASGMSPWGQRYHERVIELERLQDRMSDLAPVLEMLTGQTPADVIETK